MATTQENGSFQLDATPPPPRKKPSTIRTETPNEKAARKRAEKQQKDNTYYVDAPPITGEEEDFRHAHWKDKRRRVLTALQSSGTGRTSVDAFMNCGSECVVQYSEEEKRYKLSANLCHSRHCEPCMKAKANLFAANLQKKIADSPGKQFRFITLTLKHTDQPLKEQLDRLTACFRKLRQAKDWKDTQEGGCAIIEVKYSQDTGEWHPHLHIIAEGFFLHHRDLSATWLAITGDSFRVDIRVINSARDAAFYVAKYTSKGTNTEVWYTPHIAVEWICSMKGRRTMTTYGTWRGLKLLEKLPDTGTYKNVATLNEVVRAANRNEKWAIDCLDCLKRDNQYNPNRKRPKKGTLPAIVSS